METKDTTPKRVLMPLYDELIEMAEHAEQQANSRADIAAYHRRNAIKSDSEREELAARADEYRRLAASVKK